MGLLSNVLIVVAAVVVVFVGLVFMGAVPVLSDVVGASRPLDLGVRPTDADYASAVEKIPGLMIANPGDLCLGCPYQSRGSVPVDASFTDEEFTAHINKANGNNGAVKDVQVRFNADGSVETSGKISLPEFSGTVYAKGSVVPDGARAVKVDLTGATVAGVELPADQVPKAEAALEQAFAQYFAQNPGLSVDSLSVSDGVMAFKGGFPQELVGTPGAKPVLPSGLTG